MIPPPKKVFVGLSGGVDSSVAALRLLRAGYDVTGVFIKVWHPDFMVCNWEEERVDAMRVAATLGIPFLTCDAVAAYRDQVAHYFIESYRAGITPNPDVMCNKEIKFGVFLDFALAHGADYIATGHYVQRNDTARSEVALLRGSDQTKDQSYFLWSLTNEQLTRSLFPIGDTAKTHIRTEAKAANLPTAIKRDSQGVCFLGHVDIPDFLSHYLPLETGAVLDESGALIGTHRGAFVYTIGQRHGFTIDTKTATRTSYYVVGKNLAENTITVSAHPPLCEATTSLVLQAVLLRHTLPIDTPLTAQFRYRQTPIPIIVKNVTTDQLTLTLVTPSDRPAAGQSCVLYDGEVCLGGGIITA